MVENIQKIMDTPVITVISFISMIFFVVTTLYSIIKGIKILLKEIKLRNKLRLSIIIILFIFCGLVSPAFVLIKSFSDWTGVIFWVSQILSWYVLSVFLSVTFFVIKFEIELKQLKSL